MKQKHWILIGAGVLAIYLYKRSQDNKEVVVVAPETTSSASGGTCPASACVCPEGGILDSCTYNKNYGQCVASCSSKDEQRVDTSGMFARRR